MNLEGYNPNAPREFNTLDKWLLSRLARCEEAVRKSYESYDIQAGMAALYKFFWSDLCDWYIEQSKVRLQEESERQTPQWVLLESLTAFLKMLHPAMPFITEEVYILLPIERKEFLMSESWPTIPSEWWDQSSEDLVESWIEMTRSIRALRAEIGVQPLKSAPILYFEGDLHGGEKLIQGQAWFDEIKAGPPNGECVSITSHGVDFHIPLNGVDVSKELARVEKDIEKTSDELSKLEARLNNTQFTERAKPEVVERERQTANDLRLTLEKLQNRRAIFSRD